jgi:hypothetical protein
MAITNGQTFALADANTAIDTILTQEANRIGQDIHRRTLHVSPWMDLIKQTSFPDGMGYTLGTLIYDRALPVTTENGATLGTNWIDIGGNNTASLVSNSTLDQILPSTKGDNIGAGNNYANGKSFISFGRQLKQYSLKRATVESPKINVEDLRFAAYRTEQLRAVMDALTDATRYSWEERYRDEYDRICGNFVVCKASGTTTTTTGKETVATENIVLSGFGGTPDANVSNKVLDSIYFRLVRAGAGTNAYGRENARPVFALVCSSEASYSLITEAGFRDDYRYNTSKVSDLIAPLGVERSHRGFYHLIDDLAPRFVLDTDTDGGGADTADGTLNRVYPYTVDATTKVTIVNPAYETAPYEAAYILHQDVMESQIPEPISGSNGLTFDPVNYRGKFAWKNIPSIDLNPDGTVGFFRGVLASASKPIKTEFGYALVFQRTSVTPAA